LVRTLCHTKNVTSVRHRLGPKDWLGEIWEDWYE